MATPALRPARITTVVGGGAITVAALIWLLASPSFGFLFRGNPIPLAVTAVFLLAAMGVLAFGIRGETSIVGSSIVGKVALVIFGARNLVYVLLDKLPFNVAVLPVMTYMSSAFTLFVVVALAVAAALVVRAGVLHGFARWVLLVVAICYTIVTSLTFVPLVEVGYVLSGFDLGWWLIVPESLLVLGITYVFHGQSATVRHWMRTIYEKW